MTDNVLTAIISAAGSVAIAVTALILNSRGFAILEGRFTTLEGRFAALENRLTALETRAVEVGHPARLRPREWIARAARKAPSASAARIQPRYHRANSTAASTRLLASGPSLGGGAARKPNASTARRITGT